MSKKKKKGTNKKDLFIVFMTVALILLLIVWVISDNKKIKDNKETPIVEKVTDSFKKVLVSDALELINRDELTLIYIGYEDCSACKTFAPKLSDVADEYNIEVYYINYKEIDKDAKDWKSLTSKYTKEQTITLKAEDESTTSTTKTIGEFLANEGYTPTFAVFKNGKMLDGNVGGKTRAELRDFLNNVGYTKNS